MPKAYKKGAKKIQVASPHLPPSLVLVVIINDALPIAHVPRLGLRPADVVWESNKNYKRAKAPTRVAFVF